MTILNDFFKKIFNIFFFAYYDVKRHGDKFYGTIQMKKQLH